VLRTDRNERRDAVVVLQPRVALNGRVGRHDVLLAYDADVARYQRLDKENYFNHDFTASTNLDFSRRLKANLNSGLRFGTDARGDLETRLAVLPEPDRWRRHRIGGEIILGRRIARMQIGLGYELSGLRYLNNRQQGRDFDRRTVTVDARYNLGPRYSLLARTSGGFTDYLDPTSDLDSREYQLLGGVAWEATAKTTGELLLGIRRLDFYTPGKSGVDGFNWDARLTWAPRTYSQFTAYSARSVSASGFSAGGLGSSTTVSDTLGLRWRHGFSQRLQFEAGAERTTAAFEDAGDDEFITLQAGLRYRVSRLWEMVGSWSFDSRSSATPNGDYESGTVFFGFEAQLDRRLGR
jgi:hypothetical protein